MHERSSKLKIIYKYLVSAIILAVPLYPKFPLIEVPGTFVSVRLEDFLLALTFSFFVLISITRLKNLLKSDIVIGILLFLIIGLVSTLFGIIVLKTVLPHLGILHWIRRIEYFTAFFIGILAIKLNKGDLNYYVKLFLIVIVLCFIYGFGQKHFYWPIIITQNAEYSKGVALRYIPGSHVNSTFAGHYDLSTFLVLTLPFLIALFFILKKYRDKLLIGGVIFMGLWLMVNAASRISLFSYLLATTLSLLMLKKYKEILVIFVISLVFVGYSSNLIARYSRVFDVLKGKYLINYSLTAPLVFASENLVSPRRDHPTPTPTPQPPIEDRSTSIRLNVEWPRAIRALIKNPLLGTGFSSITLATDNDYLRLLGEVGLLGFASFLLIFVRLLKDILLKFPFSLHFQRLELAFITGVSASLIGVGINAFFIDVFEASKFVIVFWLLVGIIIGMVDNHIYEE